MYRERKRERERERERERGCVSTARVPRGAVGVLRGGG